MKCSPIGGYRSNHNRAHCPHGGSLTHLQPCMGRRLTHTHRQVGGRLARGSSGAHGVCERSASGPPKNGGGLIRGKGRLEAAREPSRTRSGRQPGGGAKLTARGRSRPLELGGQSSRMQRARVRSSWGETPSPHGARAPNSETAITTLKPASPDHAC